MNYLNVAVPFLNKNELKKRADDFRQKWWGDSLPIGIEDIIEVKLRLKIIPTPALGQFCDAIVAIKRRSIYVDNEMFLQERYKNRLRFSLAHELGHCVLHKTIYEQIKINNLFKFPEVISEQFSEEQHSRLEIQANNFASYFLIPRDKLKTEKQKIIHTLKNNKDFIKLTDIKMQNSYLAIQLANIFGVSDEAMEIALNDE